MFSLEKEGVASMQLRVAKKGRLLSVLMDLHSSSEYWALLESLSGVLERALPGYSTVLLRDFNSGQRQISLEGGDWVESPARSEPEWCFVVWISVVVIVCYGHQRLKIDFLIKD